MLSGSTPLGFAFIILSNTEVLVDVTLVDLQNDFGVLVHLLVGLCDYKRIFALAAKH